MKSRIKYILLVGCLLGCGWSGFSQELAGNRIPDRDSAILLSFWEYAGKHDLQGLPVAKRIPLIGTFFLGTPYEAGTLEGGKKEELVIRLSGLDCVTLVENTLALALLPEYNTGMTEVYKRNLRYIRYRGGEIRDYTSRLHYSGDWLYEMGKSGVLKDVTRELGGIKHPVQVDFMSRNWRKYPALEADPVLIPKIRSVETAINERTYYYIPKGEIAAISPKLSDGDIILITTGIKGLDTSHLGLAVRKGEKVYLLHASSAAKKVVLSEVPLEDYMNPIASQTGIMVGRPVRGTGEKGGFP